jgi:hypothetical protein
MGEHKNDKNNFRKAAEAIEQLLQSERAPSGFAAP